MSIAVLPSSVSRFRLLLCCAALAGACATTSSSKPPKLQTSSNPEQRFSMTGAGFQTTALITPEGAQGPQINVGRYDEGKAIRGQVGGRTIDISVSEDKASGIWGQGPLTINIEDTDTALKVNGLISGRPCTFTASRQAIQGTIGFCSYELTNSGNGVYVGSRSCGRGISSVTVDFPSTILQWKPINIAILMALLMSSP